MTLAYDYARCAGTTHPLCQSCRRREPGRAEWQSYINATIDPQTGECAHHIPPDMSEWPPIETTPKE